MHSHRAGRRARDARAAMTTHGEASEQKDSHGRRSGRWPAVPVAVQQTFDKFPLITYPPNALPGDTARAVQVPKLYLFSTSEDAEFGLPSFNSTCLKWQAYLRFQLIDVELVPSSNHAAPGGSLPFVIAKESSSSLERALSAGQIEMWVQSVSSEKASSRPTGLDDSRYSAYKSLLDHRVRNAYLYTLYLSEPNFAAVTRPLYVDRCTSSNLVRFALAHELQSAALKDLLEHEVRLDEQALYSECKKAFAALSSLLGDQENFFASAQPTLFDAHVFSYTQIFLDERTQWRDTALRDIVASFPNLVEHRRQILNTFFGAKSNE